jgi:putative ABC transport system substrate-binding protein
VKRRDFITLTCGAAATWPFAARAQQPKRMRRISALMPFAANDPQAQVRNAAFLQGLQQLGWSVGNNIQIDDRWSAGSEDDTPKFAAELLALRPDVLFAPGTSTVAPLLQATRVVPIVFVHVTDPVGGGFIESLARPGGSATGFIDFEYGISGKWLELLKQIAPGVTRAAVLRDAAVTSGTAQFAAIQAVAPSLGIEVSPVNVGNAADIERVVGAVARSANGGLIVTGSGGAVRHRDYIIGLADQYKLPAVYFDPYFVTAGGLISYGPDLIDQYRQAAGYIDRILEGEKPADLPVQAPTKYQLVRSTSRPRRRSASTCRHRCLPAPMR